MLLERHLCSAGFILLVTTACNTRPSVQDGRDAVRLQIDEGRDDRLALTDFVKADGRPGELAGVKLYTIIFTADARFRRDATFSIGGPLSTEGASITTKPYIAPTRGFSWNDFLASSQGFRRAFEGDLLRLSGEITFERRESGWTPVSARMRYALDSTERVPELAQATEIQSAPDHARSDPNVARLTSDLRNLAVAQEAFYAETHALASLADLQRGRWRASAGVTVELRRESPERWSAVAKHSSGSTVCAISGDAGKRGIPKVSCRD